MILNLYSKIKALPESYPWAAFMVRYIPLVVELMATYWVIANYSFEPVIPVYQGY